MLTNSLSLFKVLINQSVMIEKMLIIDLTASWETYKMSYIYHITWIPTESSVKSIF